MFKIKLYVFASLREYFSEDPIIEVSLDRREWLNADELKNSLLDKLIGRWYERKGLKYHDRIHRPVADSIMLAINEVYVDLDKPLSLSPMDVIALIPPVSGG